MSDYSPIMCHLFFLKDVASGSSLRSGVYMFLILTRKEKLKAIQGAVKDLSRAATNIHD